jgi:uncharacterized membrane protein
MAFCPSCGSPVEGRFCAKCGTAVNAAPTGGAGPAPGYTPGPGANPAAAQTAGMSDNMAGALCYILGLITGILFLVLAPYNQNRNIRFNAFQSIFLHVGWIAAWIVLSVVGLGMHAIPFLGTLISLLLWLVLSCGGLVLWIYIMYKTYNGEKVVLPVIGPMAEKQAGA